ncbi:MAG: DUF3568 domain-containing protein [Lentisphaerales bacterium]|nr:DUF3568 domain-containing protein [Lentisphaerales bacterium]
MKQIFIATVLALTLLLNAGCFLVLVAGGAVAGTAYVLGKLEATVDGNLDQVDAAVAKALKNLELVKMSHSKTTLEATHTSRNAKDQKISVELEKLTEKTTKIFIKVGNFGDEAMSYRILEGVKENL